MENSPCNRWVRLAALPKTYSGVRARTHRFPFHRKGACEHAPYHPHLGPPISRWTDEYGQSPGRMARPCFTGLHQQ